MVLDQENTRRLAAELGAVKTYGHFINGQWLDGHSGETIELTNPATRKTLAHIQSGDAVDVDLPQPPTERTANTKRNGVRATFISHVPWLTPKTPGLRRRL
jgi:hypothetical protein